ncbi:hypothetical protein C8J56DRAFT_1056439 [Mycena floridula]|nr:hypothetical protein C8J56DRAFT_1056439 [Mycena floridula]
MVNFLHNITVLADAATLCKIFDFQGRVINLSGAQTINGTPVISFTESGAQNENWFIAPQASCNGLFTV